MKESSYSSSVIGDVIISGLLSFLSSDYGFMEIYGVKQGFGSVKNDILFKLYYPFVALCSFFKSEGIFSDENFNEDYLDVISVIKEEIFEILTLKHLFISYIDGNYDKDLNWVYEVVGGSSLFEDALLDYCLEKGFVNQEYVDLEKSDDEENKSELEINFSSLLEIATEHFKTLN